MKGRLGAGSTWEQAALARFEGEQVKAPRDKMTLLSKVF